ncbi:GNAT family N-acetyltransferase [Alkalicoccobacillus porphyridii]|uniref:GNAT family N-acetyltransferase n=2 Tax=Alkalicoccobacillus porphyridii TaxID=2597270 RepID=A0A554A2P8_9BACI|nr:GNAT family N-acetyltransferase [Alkalicoccobacillus porphyridii]
MTIIDSEELDPHVSKLLSYATSTNKIKSEYNLYVHNFNRSLYGYESGGIIVGCVGIEVIHSEACEIKHIAVDEAHRGNGHGSEMLRYVRSKYRKITAETDKDAVLFYRSNGFVITSLGEKYPGVERFRCECGVY